MKKRKMGFFEFCDRLFKDGAYIGEDGHIYRNDGRPLSRAGRNGYYTLRKNYDCVNYCFCEHRIVYYYYNGKFDENLQVNHKDFDRSNNKIENLELMTRTENIRYSRDAGRLNPKRGEDSPRALFTSEEVQAIRYLKRNGYKRETIKDMFGINWESTFERILKYKRYGLVPDTDEMTVIYPIIVDRTWRKDAPQKDRITNALLGLSGETGELIDIFKKHMFHGHELDLNHVMLELGDILYYIVALCNEMEFDISEIMEMNAEKLYNRYPNGFEVERSLNRAEGDI